MCRLVAVLQLEKTQSSQGQFEAGLAQLESDPNLTISSAKGLLDSLYNLASDCAKVGPKGRSKPTLLLLLRWLGTRFTAP